MATKIEACPYCTSHRLHIHHHLLSVAVTCETCKAHGPHCRDIETALSDWNRVAKQVRWALAAGEPLKDGHLNSIEHAVRNLNSALRLYKTEMIETFEKEELEH